MFDNLSDKLQRVFKNLRGEGKLTAANMEAALREIRVALLEADVNFKVVKQLMEAVKEKAMGEEVLSSLTPTQQVVKIVRDELTRILGSHQSKLRFANEPPSVIMIVGLQGSGKTTSTGKLARWLSKNGHNPMMVSVDVYRPAAREQLRVVAKDVGMPVYPGTPEETKPVELARSARRETVNAGRDVLLVDTAGRLHIDEELMVELQELKTLLSPVEILFVADAVTGPPLKFVGVGEKADALEPFYPDRAASRILGMGDMLSFIEKAEEAIDKKQAVEMQRKLIENEFTLEDFRDQLRQLRKLGPLEGMLSMMPQVGILKELKNVKVDENEITRVVAIIDSMTPKERANHMLINGSRRRRIAMGSGTTVQEVNQLLKQYGQAKKMMKSFSGGMLGKKMGKMKFPFM